MFKSVPENRIMSQIHAAATCLHMLRHLDPTAIVAGGAPRDWYFGKVASDIDVFFHFRNDIQTSRITRLLEDVGFKLTSTKDGEHLPEIYKSNPDLRCVYEAELGGEKIQLMLMMQPTFKTIEHFPLNICRVWYRNGIHTTKEFEKAVEYKAIVKTSQLYNDGDKYIKKIMSKFPEYKYYGSYESLSKELLGL